ncbi:hypothetical protein MMC28_010561 [Mycoblastus sanguinarius]|nr:hypothetical protein [Mycoblastus sanguinarius]
MTSQQPRKVLDLDALKQDLHSAFASVIDQAVGLQAAAEDPVIVDRQWIVDRVKERIAPDGYGLKPKYKGLGALAVLPREIRDMIFRPLIASGHLKIMRASARLDTEVSEFIFKDGVCRMNFGFSQRSVIMRLAQSLADNIQNLSLRVNTRCRSVLGAPRDIRALRRFGGSRPIHKCCTISFECYPTSGTMVSFDFLEAVKTFTGFEKVVLTIDLDWYGEPWEGLEDWESHQIKGRIWAGYETIQANLAPTLGATDLRWDSGGQYMIFYPRKNLSRTLEEGDA